MEDGWESIGWVRRRQAILEMEYRVQGGTQIVRMAKLVMHGSHRASRSNAFENCVQACLLEKQIFYLCRLELLQLAIVGAGSKSRFDLSKLHSWDEAMRKRAKKGALLQEIEWIKKGSTRKPSGRHDPFFLVLSVLIGLQRAVLSLLGLYIDSDFMYVHTVSKVYAKWKIWTAPVPSENRML